MSENFDLLGDPIPEGHGGRGRPLHPDPAKIAIKSCCYWRMTGTISVSLPR